MVLTLSPDLHIGAARRVHSTFIFEFSLGAHKLKITPKPWDSSMEMDRSLISDPRVE